MDTSVDHLFKNGDDVFKSGGAPAAEEAGPTGETAEVDKQKTRLVSEYHRQKSAATNSPAPPVEEKVKTNTVTEDSGKPKFIKVTTLEDVQAVRCAEFHPNGNLTNQPILTLYFIYFFSRTSVRGGLQLQDSENMSVPQCGRAEGRS